MRLCDTKLQLKKRVLVPWHLVPLTPARSGILMCFVRISALMLSVLCNIEPVVSGGNFTNRCFSYASYPVQQASFGPLRLRLE